jgi:hypothetical protein
MGLPQTTAKHVFQKRELSCTAQNARAMRNTTTTILNLNAFYVIHPVLPVMVQHQVIACLAME